MQVTMLRNNFQLQLEGFNSPKKFKGIQIWSQNSEIFLPKCKRTGDLFPPPLKLNFFLQQVVPLR